MKKICEWCKCEFQTLHGNRAKYCSMACSGMARRKLNFLRREAKAKELGITVDELKRRIKRGYEARSRYGNGRIVYGLKRPKTYKEIRAANRRRQI